MCWHKWGKWETYKEAIRVDSYTNGYKGYAVIQVKACGKCGKQKLRKVIV